MLDLDRERDDGRAHPKVPAFLVPKGRWEFLYLVPGKQQRWHAMEDERRVLILADPGAGQTCVVALLRIG
jgi:hypothetical protein